MFGLLLKAGLTIAAVGLGLDLMKKHEDKVNEEKAKKEEQPRLPLLKDQEMPNTPVDLPKVMPMTTAMKSEEANDAQK